MYFYNFNIGDYRSHTAHLTPTEHYIYRSLIDWYYLNERPMPANDIDYIARILMLKTDEERQALQSVLSEFFKVKKLKLTGDTVECYHHARIDNEIKNYHHANGGRVYDHTRDITQGNVTGNDIGNVKSNVGNVIGNTQNVTKDKKCNVLTQAERTAKSKAERKKIIADLQELGADFDTNADMKSLRELHGNFFGNNLGNAIGNVGNETGNVGNSESNAFHDAITINQEPITNNQENNNNTTTAGEAKNLQSVESELVAPVISVGQFDIRTWEAPDYCDFLPVLSEHGLGGQLVLTQDDYEAEVEKFKSYNANQVAQGKPVLADENYRMDKFIAWFKQLANKQSSAKPAKTYAPVSGYDSDDDLPPIYHQPMQYQQPTTSYHPSHAKPTPKLDPMQSVMFNGVRKPFLPNMNQAETWEHVMSNQRPGESSDETYDRLAKELFIRDVA